MKGKILVIEDNEQNLYLIRYILEDCDYEVFAAMNGKRGDCAGGITAAGFDSAGYPSCLSWTVTPSHAT